VFRHHKTFLAPRRCLTHHLYETSLAPILPARVPGTATSSWVQKGSGFKRSARGRVLPSSVIEVRAILPSPYCAELAGLRLQRFGLLPAFSACCCSFFLSESGEPVFLESLNLSRILADCIGDLIVRDTAHVASTAYIHKFLSVNTVTCESGFPTLSCSSRHFCSVHDFIVHGHLAQ
jgi:hypothetical protein